MTMKEMDQTNLYSWISGIPISYGPLRLLFWIASSFTLFIISFTYLDKILRAYVIHRAVPKLNQFRVVHAAWRVLFSVSAIILFHKFAGIREPPETSSSEVKSNASAVCICNATLNRHLKEGHFSELLFLSAPVSFFLHEIILKVATGTSPATFRMGGLVGCIFAADSLKCPSICLHILYVLALNVGSSELARAVYGLKSRLMGFEGPPASILLRIFAPLLFLFHIFWWLVVVHSVLPSLFKSLPAVTDAEPGNRLATAYVNIFVILFFKDQIFNTPAWSLIYLLVKRPSGIHRLRSVSSLPNLIMLPYSSTLLPELRKIQMTFLLNALPTSAERRKIRKRILSSKRQESMPVTEEKAALMSVIKCVSILKRKMRARYEQKASNEASSSRGGQGSDVEGSSNEQSGERPEGPSETEDVTDIYISVPCPKNDAEATSSSKDHGKICEQSLEVEADVHISVEDGDLLCSNEHSNASPACEKVCAPPGSSEDEQDSDER